MKKMVPDPSTGKPSNVATSPPLSEANSTLKLAFLSWSVGEELPVCVSECVGMYDCVRLSSAERPRKPGPREDIELPTMVMV